MLGTLADSYMITSIGGGAYSTDVDFNDVSHWTQQRVKWNVPV